MTDSAQPILPGATIGFLGGGQLGRMTAFAARSMGYDIQVLDPEAACATRPVASRTITAKFDDVEAAVALASECDVVTLEIEQMVQQMQSAVSSGVMEMDRFSDQVRRGVHDVATAGTQLTEIINRVNSSTDSFKQVNESMQSQSEGAQHAHHHEHRQAP